MKPGDSGNSPCLSFNSSLLIIFQSRTALLDCPICASAVCGCREAGDRSAAALSSALHALLLPSILPSNSLHSGVQPSSSTYHLRHTNVSVVTKTLSLPVCYPSWPLCTSPRPCLLSSSLGFSPTSRLCHTSLYLLSWQPQLPLYASTQPLVASCSPSLPSRPPRCVPITQPLLWP